ncbi:DgyrCDS7070 [Dimorphilus gyrociliatus]|uniref:DgyrCDS7070 n=1 Tax=Dimorphilus gyrociliatus TaxID=2664684 RepID=A0A7I8VQL9_9ANNE|nr:DgyrCDS7070 [Dimorphilus gyrociliatus]
MWMKALLVCSIFLIASGGVIKEDPTTPLVSSAPQATEVPDPVSNNADKEYNTTNTNDVDDNVEKEDTVSPTDISENASDSHSSETDEETTDGEIKSGENEHSEQTTLIETPEKEEQQSTPLPSTGDDTASSSTNLVTISGQTTTDSPIRNNGSIGTGGSSILPGWFEPKEKKQIILIKENERDDDILPKQIKSSFAVSKDESIKLNLKRVENIKAFPTILDEDEAKKILNNLFPSSIKGDGKPVFNLGVYQDKDNHAAMIVSGAKRGSVTLRSMEGKFVMKEKKYKLTKIEKKDFSNELNGFPENNDPVKDGVPHVIQPIGEDEEKPTNDNEPIPGGGSIVFGAGEGGLAIDSEEHSPPAASDDSTFASPTQTQTTCKDIHIEVMAVVPKDVYQFFYTREREAGRPHDFEIIKRLLQLHYAEIFNDADVVYKSIDARRWGICVTLWLSNLKFLVENSQDAALYRGSYLARGTSYETDVVDSDTILDNLGEWKVRQSYGWYKMDVIVLFTKRNLARKDQSAAGYSDVIIGTARWNGVCKFGKEGGLAVIEDIGSASWWPLAHEVAHVIGAVHDGSDSAVSCANDQMNIMAPVLRTRTPSQYEKAYKFSDCSIRDIKRLVTGEADKYKRTCLANKNCVSFNKQEVGTLDPSLGDNFRTKEYDLSITEQCKARFTLSHGACPESQRPWAVDICSHLYCSVPTDDPKVSKCVVHKLGAADRTPCGTLGNRWCYKGVCIDKSETPSAEEIGVCKSLQLPLGEECTTSDVGNDCSGSVIKTPYRCQTSIFKPLCCNSCRRYNLLGDFYDVKLTQETTKCKDTDTNCPNLVKKYTCDLIKDLCPVTCNACPTSTISPTANPFSTPVPTTVGPKYTHRPGPCNPNPCQNNAECLESVGGGYFCDCPRGYDGYDCQICKSTFR